MSPAAHLFEFLTIFVGLPVAVRWRPQRLYPIPMLWLGTAYCLFMLWHDPTFPRASLWNAHAGEPALLSVLLIFGAGALLITLAVRHYAPETLFNLPRTRPRLWAAIMLGYPVLSVYPQGIVYRAFLMHRYAEAFAILPHGLPQAVASVLLSAAAFAFMHIVFRNPIAVALTFLGGVLFAWHYQRTGSLAISTLEHTLYGCLMFTVGLGEYFYHARVEI